MLISDWQVSVGASLQRAITLYSANLEGQRNDGLRVLKVPIGSQSFCQVSIAAQVEKMEANSTTNLSGLDDLQTQPRLFKTCTSHKMTHLFAADALCSNKLPNNWYIWDSPTTNSITKIYSNFMAHMTNRNLLTSHTRLISSMSTNKGGLALPP